MTYDVQRWEVDWTKGCHVEAADGDCVLAADAEAHERAAVRALLEGEKP